MESFAANTSSLVLTGRYLRPRIADPVEPADGLADVEFAGRLIADLTSKGLVPGTFSGLRPIDADPAVRVDDKPFSGFVQGADGRALAVLSLSNGAYPNLVRQQFEGAAVARFLLGASLEERILKPIASGFVAGRSFAIWPLRCPLSANRLRKGLEKRRLAGSVMRWLKAVARRTQVELNDQDTARLYAEPLFRMAEDIDLGADIRKIARQAITGLDSGDWRPKSVLSHNDLWMGNVLVSNAPLGGLILPRKFAVIDWAGSSVKGYPLFDAISFGESVGRSASRLRRDLVSYCDDLGIAPRHSASYVCAALGAVVLKADCFPKPRFINLCSNMMWSLRRTGMAT